MASNGSLSKYKKKRDFRKTTEPGGEKKITKGAKPIFVIQKHDASHLHYDFRIEVNGVLKSWAVPKGPSTDPAQKRLAVPTEDHPLEYSTFEGVIPEGEYGAGTVMVWDTGTYQNLKNKDGKSVPMERTVRDGHIEIRLEGRKLRGAYALIRTGNGEKDSDTRWLLIKMKDNEADARRNPVSAEPNSALSNRSLDKIRKASQKNNKGKKDD